MSPLPPLPLVMRSGGECSRRVSVECRTPESAASLRLAAFAPDVRRVGQARLGAEADGARP